MRGSPIGTLIRARIRIFFREPAAIFWVFLFPLVLALVLGIAFRDRPPEPSRVGVPTDHPGAAALTRALQDDPDLTLTLLPRAELDPRLDRGTLDTIAELDEGRATLRFDPLRPEARLGRLLVERRIQAALHPEARAEITEQTAMPRGARFIDFLIPGLIAMSLMGSSLWGVGYGMVQERSKKLMRRFATTPLSRTSFLLSYIASRLLFLVIVTFLFIAFGAWVFDVQIQGSIASFALVAIIGVLCFCGFAVLCASRTDSPEVMSGYINALTFPMWLMSGVFFAWERFPEVLHPFIQALPLTALNDALRAIANEGAGLLDVLPMLAVLALWGVVTFALGVRLFRWR